LTSGAYWILSKERLYRQDHATVMKFVINAAALETILGADKHQLIWPLNEDELGNSQSCAAVHRYSR